MEQDEIIIDECDNGMNNINKNHAIRSIESVDKNNIEENESEEGEERAEFNDLKNNNLSESLIHKNKKNSTDEIRFIKANLLFLNHQVCEH